MQNHEPRQQTRQTGSCLPQYSTKYRKSLDHWIPVVHCRWISFKTCLSAQYSQYFSWKPDTSAKATDAFLQVWTHIKVYANPPWNLIGQTLAQVQTQQANIILVAPVWRSQPQYPTLLHMLLDHFRLITTETEIVVNRDNLLLLPQLAI